MKSVLRLVFALLVTSLFWSAGALAQEEGYLSSPAVRGDVLVFSSEGDLWRASVQGGTATRMTTHRQVETDAAISPDGRLVAFTGQYDGPVEVYVMPLVGGAPARVTFEGGGVRALGWTPAGKVLFSSANEPGTRPRVLRTVDPETKQVSTLELEDATVGTYDASGERLFFTRFGLAVSNDNARLYRGGLMSQLWRYDAGAEEAVRLAADFGAPMRHPMWWDGRVYFISDKDGADNIWSMAEDGGDARQLTQFEGWELRAPHLSGGVIVYQRGAELYRFDIATAQESRINILLDSDRDFTRTRWLDAPLDYLDAAHIGPMGTSVTLTARANVVVAYPGGQRRIELQIPADARARDGRLGPKGLWVYVVLDRGLRGEIWRFPADGRGSGEPLTEGSDAHIWGIYPSPDGKQILYHDKRARLWSLDLDMRRKTLLETGQSGSDRAFADMAWSRHGRYVAYSVANARGLDQIVVRDLRTGTRAVVSGDKYIAFSPAFSLDGDWLYFVSHRSFSASPSAPWGDRNTGPAFDRRGQIYAVQLTRDAHFPFVSENELAQEAGEADDGAREEGASDDGQGHDGSDADILFEGLAERLWQVPVPAGNYFGLQAGAKFLFVQEQRDDKTALKTIKINPVSADMSVLVGDVRGFDLSTDRKTLLYATGGNGAPQFFLIPAGPKRPRSLSASRVRIGDWRLGIQPRAEWRQQFLDAWRLHRDFAYDPELRRVDWDAVREKYLPLVDRIGHRSELNDLLGQMAAEIGILHSQVRSGDLPTDEESGEDGSIGAVLVSHARGLEIVQIYQGEEGLIGQLGPLLKPGVDVQVGDVLSAVDGRSVASHGDLARALSHKAGQEVRLDLLRDGRMVSAIVRPFGMGGLRGLRYRHWVEMNRRAVADASGNRVGYLHLRAMGAGDIASFVRDFYEHYDKDGLIIDVRGNFGGNIDSFLLSILQREVWAFWPSELGGPPSTNMQQTFRGHLAVLVDEGTYSDGETFAAGIKALDLGPLIGMRTAGAGIWLSDRNRLSDRGAVRVAESPQSGLDGRWLIEGRGVSPDIAVVNLPRASFLGQDAQLDAAMAYLEDKIRVEPIPELEGPDLPPLGQYGQDVE